MTHASSRVQARLISRAVSLTGVLASVLKLIRNGEPITNDELLKYEREVREWNADARAIGRTSAPTASRRTATTRKGSDSVSSASRKPSAPKQSAARAATMFDATTREHASTTDELVQASPDDTPRASTERR